LNLLNEGKFLTAPSAYLCGTRSLTHFHLTIKLKARLKLENDLRCRFSNAKRRFDEISHVVQGQGSI
jgi:hypothetical protein